MKTGRLTRIVAIIMAVIMGLTIVIAAISSFAGARVTQAEIDRLREEHREYQRRRQEIQSRINSIEFEMLAETAQKAVLDDRIRLTIYQINNLYDIIAHYEVLIIEMGVEVERAIYRENEQLERFRRRVRDMEENGVIHYLEIIFNFSSFSDLLARIDVVSEIMRSEERLYNDLVSARNATIAARERLYDTMLGMEVEVALREEKRQELNEQIEEAGQLIKRLMEDRDAERELNAQKAAAAEQIQRDINRAVAEFERQQAAARAAARAAAGNVTGTGSFIWPVPSSHHVTSYFGTRLHPVFRVMRTHWGIDIAANHGAAVVAADSGTVITSAFDSSYGHFIVIAHGNGYTTLYAHLSTRRVQERDTVYQGQTIGLIGSTGTSTGPHLHFEVSRGGERVDPLQYFRRG